LEFDGDKWSASCPGHLTPEETAPETNWIGGWVGPKAGLDEVVKRKKSLPSVIESWLSSP